MSVAESPSSGMGGGLVYIIVRLSRDEAHTFMSHNVISQFMPVRSLYVHVHRRF